MRFCPACGRLAGEQNTCGACGSAIPATSVDCLIAKYRRREGGRWRLAWSGLSQSLIMLAAVICLCVGGVALVAAFMAMDWRPLLGSLVALGLGCALLRIADLRP